MLKVAVVILNWNGKAFLKRYLPSVVKYSDLEGVKVIVADNGSTDDSVEFLNREFPFVGTIKLEKNFGFAEGYNQAIASLEAEYFVLLNSDVEVSPGWLLPMIKLLDKNPLVAACMPKILSSERKNLFEYAGAAGGFIDKYGFTFCQGRIFDSIETDYGQYDKAKDIFWASGACLMIRGPLYKLSGGLDPGFFAHMEEIDLCWRLKNRGYRIMVQPDSIIYHLGGGTLPQGNPKKTYLNYRNNLFLLYKNLPDKSLKKIIVSRILFDILSSLRFIAKFSIREFFAVYKALLHFFREYKKYKYFRESEAKFISRFDHREIFPGSIVKEYFIRKKYTFLALQWFNKFQSD